MLYELPTCTLKPAINGNKLQMIRKDGVGRITGLEHRPMWEASGTMGKNDL